jgi:hypothetical protein
MKFVLTILLLTCLPLSAQDAEWQQSKIDDPLHGTVVDKFVLSGTYVTPPAVQSAEPSLEVLCAKNKFRRAYIHFGGVVRPEEWAKSLKGNQQAKMEARADEHKFTQYLEITNDSTSLAADKIEFSELLTGRLFKQHPGDPNSLVHRLVVGVNVGALSPGIVIQFEMPSDQERLVSTCDLQEGRKKKK